MRGRGPAIVFDFDGTLIDTREIKTRNYIEAFEAVYATGPELRPAVRESCLRTSGANRFLQLEDTMAAVGIESTEEQRSDFSRRYSALNAKALSTIGEFPSVRAVLAKLARAAYALFAASGILDEEFRVELLRRGLMDAFVAARGGDKQRFLESLRSAGYGPIFFVGDTSYDRAAAEAAGVTFHLVEADADLVRLTEQLTRGR